MSENIVLPKANARRRILRKKICGGLWTKEHPRLRALPAAKIPCG
jgi:hypothetical protein